MLAGVDVRLGTPRKLPKPNQLQGTVAVLDIAFASESGGRRNAFEKTTLKFIQRLGERLHAWIDHHDSDNHARFVHDPRFVLATKQQHGACPEMVTPAVVARLGPVDTIVCHNDFDGLASAAKWLRNGMASYPGCDDDARAIDTRIGPLSPTGVRFDHALRARPRDVALQHQVLAHLYEGLSQQRRWVAIDEAAATIVPRLEQSKRLARNYRALSSDLVMVEVDAHAVKYDKTELLLLGQQLAPMSLVVSGETATFAAAFDSGINFLERFGFSGGMPTLVSVHKSQLHEVLAKLGVAL
ncbi:MAG TPA: hypothetical protein ENK23_07845 [Sorangium sp.]|nr:hypothetical protein [Sorangium sp.]